MAVAGGLVAALLLAVKPTVVQGATARLEPRFSLQTEALEVELTYPPLVRAGLRRYLRQQLAQDFLVHPGRPEVTARLGRASVSPVALADRARLAVVAVRALLPLVQALLAEQILAAVAAVEH